ncbi:hypothetical protein GX586_16295 [bacterium]|nr:hypothetical protein [bacterium]
MALNRVRAAVFACIAFSVSGGHAMPAVHVQADLAARAEAFSVSRNATLTPSWRDVCGVPLPSLHLALGASPVAAFAQARLALPDGPDPGDGAVECIGAWALTGGGHSGVVARVAVNGMAVYDGTPSTNLLYWRAAVPAGIGVVTDIAWSVTYCATAGAAGVEWVLPALIRTIDDTNATRARLVFGTGREGARAWRLAGVADGGAGPWQPGQEVACAPHLRVTRIAPRMPHVQNGVAAHLAAEIRNEGWEASGTDSVDSVTLALDENTGAVSEQRFIEQPVPPMPGRGFTEVLWTVFPHLHADTLSGTVTVARTGQAVAFSFPVAAADTVFTQNTAWGTAWTRIRGGRGVPLIAYDWQCGTMRLRFIQEEDGVRTVKLGITRDGICSDIAELAPLASLKCATAAGGRETISFQPARIRHTASGSLQTVQMSDMQMSADGSVWTMNQSFTYAPAAGRIVVETAFSGSQPRAILDASGPVAVMQCSERTAIVMPRYAFGRVHAAEEEALQYPWLSLAQRGMRAPLAGQIAPFVCCMLEDGMLTWTAASEPPESNPSVNWRIERPAVMDRHAVFRARLCRDADAGRRHVPPPLTTNVTLRAELSLQAGEADMTRLFPQPARGAPGRIVLQAEQAEVSALVDSALAETYSGSNDVAESLHAGDHTAARAAMLWMEAARETEYERRNRLGTWLSTLTNALDALPVDEVLTCALQHGMAAAALFMLDDEAETLYAAGAAAQDRLCAEAKELTRRMGVDGGAAAPAARACGAAAARLLLAAAVCGNRSGVAAACDLLDAARGLRTPADDTAGPTASSIDACAELIEANVLAFRLTGDERYFREAWRWAHAGQAFFGMRGTEVCELASARFGVPAAVSPLADAVSPEMTLLYADALRELFNAGETPEQWLRYPRTIVQAAYDVYRGANVGGMMPAGLACDGGARVGGLLFPDGVWLNRLRDRGCPPRLSCQSFTLIDRTRVYAVTPADARIAKDKLRDEAKLTVAFFPHRTSRVLFPLSPRAISFELNGNPVPQLRSLANRTHWYYLEDARSIMLEIHHESEVMELTLQFGGRL